MKDRINLGIPFIFLINSISSEVLTLSLSLAFPLS